MDRLSQQAISVHDAAIALGVSRKTIYRMISQKKLGAFKVLRDWRIPVSEIQRLLAVSKS